ncbi:hypothetical protein ACVXPY_30185 [Klebsiella pneumoniae]|uniref:hypothetical protein n=1 Tax=Klebsiella pneumoniae TaxID=573 RepID=UPI00117A925B|nr:hypothetical protein [Klebsiella pneumoniae]
MTPEEKKNALRSIARRANDEVKAQRRSSPALSCDEISRPILNGCMPLIKQLGLTPSHLGDAGNLKIDKYRPGAPFLMAGDSIQHMLFAIFGEFHLFLMPHPCPKTPATRNLPSIDCN